MTELHTQTITTKQLQFFKHLPFKFKYHQYFNPKQILLLIWLVVSTQLKNISQNWNLPQIGVKIKNVWNHHLVIFVDKKRPCGSMFKMISFPSRSSPKITCSPSNHSCRWKRHAIMMFYPWTLYQLHGVPINSNKDNQTSVHTLPPIMMLQCKTNASSVVTPFK